MWHAGITQSPAHMWFWNCSRLSCPSVKRLALDMPNCITQTPAPVPFAGMRTIAVMEHTILGLISGADDRKNLTRSAEVAEALAETTGEIDPASSCCQAGLRNHVRRDRWLIEVTEFTSRSARLSPALPRPYGKKMNRL